MTTRRERRNGLRLRHILLLFWRVALGLFFFLCVIIVVFASVRPPPGFYMMSEGIRLQGFEQRWRPYEEIAPVMGRSVVAAEDANFCVHNGVDWDELFEVIEEGSNRGASTISQQVAKNVFLWHGRSYLRKGIEIPLAVVIDRVWGKRRILEVYLNVAEFDEGVFGVEAAAYHYFNVSAADLSALQAARLASILPDPKDRSASNPGSFTNRRANQIVDGAATIQADGRADCFD
ncbi:MAG: monofunctional biosynthetic peptidoglycan transglycosylase [Pseudomonadota bacterium]